MNIGIIEVIVVAYALAFIFGLLYRFVLKKFAAGSSRGVSKNIGMSDRLLRVTIGIGLFAWAAMSNWSFGLLFFSGFCIFEAIFSWCGFYAAVGQNTCPMD